MALTDQMVRQYFGDARLSLGLAWAGVELDDGGYRRHLVPAGGWQIDGPSASATGHFGPFAGQVTFNEAFIADDTGILERVPLGGTVSIDVAERTEWFQGVTFTVGSKVPADA